MNEQVQIITSIDGLRQFARDIDRFGAHKALILAYVRHRNDVVIQPHPTIEDIAVAVGIMDQEAYDMVRELVTARRLDWTVISSPDRKSRVRVA